MSQNEIFVSKAFKIKRMLIYWVSMLATRKGDSDENRKTYCCTSTYKIP